MSLSYLLCEAYESTHDLRYCVTESVCNPQWGQLEGNSNRRLVTKLQGGSAYPQRSYRFAMWMEIRFVTTICLKILARLLKVTSECLCEARSVQAVKLLCGTESAIKPTHSPKNHEHNWKEIQYDNISETSGRGALYWVLCDL